MEVFRGDRWLCSYEELRDELVGFVKERGLFDSDTFFAVSDYLVRGNVQQYHREYVNEIAQRMNLAGATNQRDSSASRIVDYTIRNALLFNNTSTPYVRIGIDGHYEIWPVDSQSFKRHIAREFYDVEGIVTSTAAMNTALTVIEGKAIYEGVEIKLHNRVARYEDAIYFDLSNSQWQAVRITPQGWEVIDEPPPIFRRYSHQKQAVLPQRIEGETLVNVLESIFDLVNYDPENKLLFLVLLVFSLVPDVPHPIPVVYGEQGSAKSSLFRVWKSLVDPSELQTMSFPRKMEELIQKIDHHWFSTFDNITKLSEWQSDLICRAMTGDGFSKRRLYTDDEDFIYTFKRVVGLNGINIVAEKPDLLDRSVLIRLPAIPISKRMDEEELWMKFDELAPSLIAALFDVLSEAMRIRPSVKINGNYRMADFTKWGCAITQALGYTQDTFVQEYHRNLNQQNIEALEIDPVGVVIESLWESYKAAGRIPIRIAPAQAYYEMEQIACTVGVTLTGKTWPKNTQVMGRRLNQLSANLRQQGIDFSSERDDRKRYWVFSEVDPSEYCVSCVIPSNDDEDAIVSSETHDGILTESEHAQNSVKRTKGLDSDYCSSDAMTDMTELSEQSHSSQILSPEVILSLLAQRAWTEGNMRDEAVKLGYTRESFENIFRIVKQDARVHSRGITPIYYIFSPDS